MSRGKYSPYCPKGKVFKYNAYGRVPESYLVGQVYDERIHFANYDDEGYDSYGYSCYDGYGNYVGIGNGLDRLGYTESDYLTMSDDDFNDIVYSQCYKS